MSAAAPAARVRLGNLLLAGMAALYVAAVILPLPAERAVLAAAAICALVTTVLRSSRFYQIATLAIMAGAGAIVLATPATLGAAWLGFGDLTDVTVLLLAIPVLAVPFWLRAYGDDLGALVARWVRRPASQYAVLSGSSATLAAMISIGAAPVTHASIRFHRHSPPLESRAITRGVVLGIMWSPMGGFFTTVLARVNAAPATMMSLCLAAAVVAWAADAATTGRTATTRPPPARSGPAPAERRTAVAGSITLVAAIVTYSALLIALHELTGITIIDAVILVVVPYVLLWALFLGELGPAFSRIRETVRHEASAVCSQISVLISMGFLGAAFLDAGFSDGLATWLDAVDPPGGLTLFLLGAVPLLLAPLGLHPFIVVVLLLGIVDAEMLGVPAEALGLALMGGGAGALALSQFSAVVNISASLTRLTAARVALFNLRFGLLLWLLAGVLALGVTMWAL